MFGSETLEVAIGLAVLFSFMSLFATAFRESIEAWMKQRSKLMHKAMAELFAEGNENSPTLKEFYESIAISPLYRGAYNRIKGELPSYITSQTFASAILDLAQTKAGAGADLAQWKGKLADKRLSDLVRFAFQASGQNEQKARKFLEDWYDDQMERVSGWYKRETHWILLWIGFLSAALLNVDAIAVTQHLYRNDALRDVIVARAEAHPPAPPATSAPSAGQPGKEQEPTPVKKSKAASGRAETARTSDANSNAVDRNETAAAGTNIVAAEGNSSQAPTGNRAGSPPAGSSAPASEADDSSQELDRILGEVHGYGFPIGWSWHDSRLTPGPQCALKGRSEQSCTLNDIGWLAILLMFAGWAVTALAISLGSPFWFDLLNKMMVIRSTVKPFEKSQPEGSEDRPAQKPAATTTAAASTAKPAKGQ